MERGTYSEFLSRVDIFPFWEGGGAIWTISVPGAHTVISESLVQSFQSPDPRWKMRLQRTKMWVVPGSVCPWWSHGPSVCSGHDIFICPKVDPSSKVLFHGTGRIRRVWGEQACLGFPFGAGWRILWRSMLVVCCYEFLSECGSHWLRTLQFTIVTSYSCWWPWLPLCIQRL